MILENQICKIIKRECFIHRIKLPRGYVKEHFHITNYTIWITFPVYFISFRKNPIDPEKPTDKNMMKAQNQSEIALRIK